MSLRDKLSKIKEDSAKKIPDEAKEIMRQATRSLAESGQVEKILGPGDKIPDFTLKNQDGRLLEIYDLYSKGPLVLQFYRGYWWPYCNAELEALQKSYQQFQQAGAELVAISPMTAEYTDKIISKHSLAFPVLIDSGNNVADKFGLLYQLPQDLQKVYSELGIDLPRFNADESWTLPIPARYVVDSNGAIINCAVSADYSDRPDPEETLAILRQL